MPCTVASRAESGRLERHARRRALVSSEARSPDRFTLPRGPNGGRTRITGFADRHLTIRSSGHSAQGGSRTLTPEGTRFWAVRGCQLRHSRICRPLPTQSGYRESDPGPHLGKVMRCHYATSAWSLPGESNPDRLRTREACCLCHQAGTTWRPTIRTRTTRAKTSRAAVTPAAIVSPPPVPTRASFPYKGRPDAGPEGIGTLGEIRTHTAHRLGVVPPTVLGYERLRAAVRCRSGPPALRGQGRSRARRRGYRGYRGYRATGAGIEPACSWFRARAGCQQPTRYRVRKARVERASREV